MEMLLRLLLGIIMFAALVLGDPRVGQPLNVTYDGRAVLINGSHILLISGSIHYPRSSPAMWDSMMKQSIAAGLNMIQTYVFWNLHEPEKGVYNFEDNADIVQFLNIAKANQLFVNLRIGPYICAEWNYGGFPAWLREIPGIVFRDYNQPFMTEMQTWMTYIVKILSEQKMFAPQGGPIILAQVENEYFLMEPYYAGGFQYAMWAASMVQNLSVGVPWIMCKQGNVPTVINTWNGFYGESFIQPHETTYPNQPLMWTENWPGWMQDWGQATPHRPVQDVMYAAARWFAKGGTHMNYYMWQGGTNFGRWSGENVITSYDYDVAIDEYGYPYEPKYSHSAAFHAVMIKFADTLLSNPHNTTDVLGPNLEADVYGTGTTQLVFLSNTGANLTATVTWQGTNFTLPPWSVSLINGAQVLYNTAIIPSTTINPTFQQTKSTLGQANITGWWEEPIGVWGAGIVFSSPPMQLDVTHDKTDYLWYTTEITITDSHTLTLSNVQDRVSVYLNNTFLGVHGGGAITIYLPSSISGIVTLQLLTSTLGLADYGPFLERYAVGLLGNVMLGSQNITKATWTVQPGLKGEALEIYTTSGNANVTWNPNIEVNRPLTWYTGTFAMPPNPNNETTGYAFDMWGMTKGMMWVNGHSIGRNWNITAQGDCSSCTWAGGYSPSQCMTGCGSYSQKYYHVPQDWLQQSNFVVVFEEIGGDPRTISLIARTGVEVTVVADEDSTLELTCGDKQILSIESAIFGKKRICETGICSEDICSIQTVAYAVVEKLCLDRTSCYIPAERDIMGGEQCPLGSALTVKVLCG